MTAPVASGWSGCRVGLTPTGKRRLCTAHTHFGHWTAARPNGTLLQISVILARSVKRGIAKLEPKAIYLFLLAVQTAGAIFFIARELPDFRQLALYPGEQLPYMRSDDVATIGALLAMQAAYWYRLHRVPIPFRGPNAILSHFLLFLGRLSFIFGGSLFAVVFFRHLPELDQGVDTLLMARRGVLLVGSLFALFCFALELERLGNAIGASRQD